MLCLYYYLSEPPPNTTKKERITVSLSFRTRLPSNVVVGGCGIHLKNAGLLGHKGLNTEHYILTTIQHPRHHPRKQQKNFNPPDNPFHYLTGALTRQFIPQYLISTFSLLLIVLNISFLNFDIVSYFEFLPDTLHEIR